MSTSPPTPPANTPTTPAAATPGPAPVIPPTGPSAVTGTMADATTADIALAAYNQNFETFRSLNNLMWQIPLIAMTLTGGLWFGVSKVDSPTFQIGLLALAAAGNVGLIFVLARLRLIIGEYLSWLGKAFRDGHVAAEGRDWGTRSRTVRTVFQLMLGFAAAMSVVLIVATVLHIRTDEATPHPTDAVAYYDAHAERLADGYEGLDSTLTHPKLFELLRSNPAATVLDVGAGTGRDAAAMAALGHRVTAAEPSAKMLLLARRLHPVQGVSWMSDALPALAHLRASRFDFVVLSAVWMHVPPGERRQAFSRLVGLRSPSGKIYMTLRLGPDDAERGMYAVDADEIRRLAQQHGLRVVDMGKQKDLLGRRDVSWQTLLVE